MTGAGLSGRLARWLDRLAPAIVVVAVLAVFWPALGNQFVNWDDDMNVTENPRFRGLSPAHLRWMFTTVHGGHYQPLSWLSLAFDYRGWGMNPFGYHLTSVLLHAANALLLYFLIRALLGRRSAHQLGAAALAGALFFGLHPLRVESVAWVTARRDVLSGLFFLGTVLAYLRMADAQGGRQLVWLGISLVCFACSLLSKAWGVPLPAVLLALDVYPLRRFARVPVRALLEKLAYGALAVAAAAMAVSMRDEMVAARTLEQHGVVERIAQAAYGLCFYLWKTVLPVGLSPLYPLPPALDPFEPRFVACAAIVLAVTIALVALRRRSVPVLVAWLSYAILLFPLLGVLQLGPQLVADRYTYLACMPWAVLLGAAVTRVPVARAVPAVALIAVTLGTLTARQVRVWHDSDALWEQALRVDPGNWVAYTNRAVLRERRGDGRGAIDDYTEALRHHAGYPLAWANRGTLRQELGDLPGAIDDLTMATRLSPTDWRSWNNRGWARQLAGDLPGAVADYREALRVAPADLPGRGQIAQNLAAAQAVAGPR
jgi:protein O-mannosyl-transferase